MGVLAPGSICPGLPKLVLRTSFGDLQEKAPYSCAVANSSDCHNSQRLTACAKMLNWRKFWKRGRALQVLRDFDVAPNGRAIAFPLPTRHVCKTRRISRASWRQPQAVASTGAGRRAFDVGQWPSRAPLLSNSKDAQFGRT